MSTVRLTLAERTGTRRESLTNIKWAWFDQTDPQNFTAPTDTGTTETTDATGLIEVTLSGSALAVGQQGCLALMTSDNVDSGLYRLTVRP